MKIGYARVSTDDQNLDLQLDALKKEGCEKIYQDTISGMKKVRPGLDEALSHLRKGDTLVVWKLDRLGRSLKGLLDLIENFFRERSSSNHSQTASTPPRPWAASSSRSWAAWPRWNGS